MERKIWCGRIRPGSLQGLTFDQQLSKLAEESRRFLRLTPYKDEVAKLTPAERHAILNDDAAAIRPQPVDYAQPLAYKQAVRRHCLHELLNDEAERQAEQTQRLFWQRLSGYEFESETAKVLKLHQFSPMLRGGAADGGIDIEVTRAGQKGVVQCKAHVKGVGPHVVRDLFGVMHDSGYEFGIIVSLGGFTPGAVDFAAKKRIFLVDLPALMAMQEGKDVLANGFVNTEA